MDQAVDALIGAGYGSAGEQLHGGLGRGARRQDHRRPELMEKSRSRGSKA